MATLKAIKSKIISYKKTGTVTHAMEAVSAVKMRKSQGRALGSRAYAAAALSILERLSGTAGIGRHPLMQKQEGMPVIIVITSDKGLAGSLNSGVIRAAEKELGKLNADTVNKTAGVVIAIGRRGGEYFASRGYDVPVRHLNLSDGVAESEVRAITDEILKLRERTYGPVYVAYQNFISTFEQHPTVRQIVPVTPEVISQMVEGIRPAKGKYAPREKKADEVKPAVYTIEPDENEVLDVLLPKLLNIAIFHALLEGKASEHSARMVAMKSATDKAKEMAQMLTRQFNKVRQAVITREVSEITSGIEAMK
jgi:F-type H+-transporting ATPase subunit gamma